jgi:hypothetical protein
MISRIRQTLRGGRRHSQDKPIADATAGDCQELYRVSSASLILPMPQHPSLPPELMEAIAREAWLDVALWDHTELYLALVQTHSYLRAAMPVLAWKYIFCRSRKEFRLYLHLRYRDVLSLQQKDIPHAELHISSAYLDDLRHESRETNSYGRPAFDGLLAGEEFHAVPMVSIYAAEPNGTYGVMSCTDLNTSLVDVHKLTDLRLINSYFHHGRWPRHVTYSTLQHLTFTSRDDNYFWTHVPLFYMRFPTLRSLTIRGTIIHLSKLLPLLPETLEELVLETHPTYRSSEDGVYAFGLLSALSSGFKIGRRGARAPRVVILTGPESLLMWYDAMVMAEEKGVHLERRIEHRPPHTEAAILRPLPYDLNVAFRDVRVRNDS